MWSTETELSSFSYGRHVSRDARMSSLAHRSQVVEQPLRDKAQICESQKKSSDKPKIQKRHTHEQLFRDFSDLNPAQKTDLGFGPLSVPHTPLRRPTRITSPKWFCVVPPPEVFSATTSRTPPQLAASAVLGSVGFFHHITPRAFAPAPATMGKVPVNAPPFIMMILAVVPAYNEFWPLDGRG